MRYNLDSFKGALSKGQGGTVLLYSTHIHFRTHPLHIIYSQTVGTIMLYLQNCITSEPKLIWES